MIGARYFLILPFFFSLAIYAQGKAKADFDGDGKTDITVLRPESNGAQTWHTLLSSNGGYGYAQWGIFNGDRPVVGDFDGDGKQDYAIWRTSIVPDTQSYFYILRSSDLTWQAFPWGLASVQDGLLVQDYDGDGKDDPAVYRATNSGFWEFYILQSSGGIRSFSIRNNLLTHPLKGDYDGDGKADLAFTTSGSIGSKLFTVFNSSDGKRWQVNFGLNNFDRAVPGDYDGDGKTDIAVWRGLNTSSGIWFWLRSSDGQLGSAQLGAGSANNDVPIPADFDGDGKADPAIWRAQFGSPHYWILGSSMGLKVVHWGRFDTLQDDPLLRY